MVEEKVEAKTDKIDEITAKMRSNPWMVSTIVLGVVVLIFFYFYFGTGITGNVVKGDKAGAELVTYLNTRTGGGVEYKSVKDLGGLYEVTVTYQNQDIPVYTSKDGKYFIQSAVPITADAVANSDSAAETPAEVPKSDKPVVDLYVFSYCPYGLQAEKGFVPVYNLLKNKADINIKFIGAMHGAYEETESLRQLCILKNYGKDKFMSYIAQFAVDTGIGNCGSDPACAKPLTEKIMTSLGINPATINSCMTSDGKTLYAADEAAASQAGVSGSPTLVINGVDVQSGRSSAEYLKTICSAFNTAPAECSQTVSSASPSPGFGATAGSASSSAASCG